VSQGDAALESISARTRAAYDRIAPAYLERNGGPPPPELIASVDRFAAMLPPGARVLDLGCGPGIHTAWLRERGLRPVGGDLSAGMLEQARRLANAPLVQLDMRSLPFARSCFDGVWWMASLLHLPKREAPMALAEARRVLVPGGLLALDVQEGDGETWQDNYDAGLPRFFARYGSDEMAGMLEAVDFAVSIRERNATRARAWLSFVARSRSPGAP
jgi:ubiquinone/menaquinone biosynthesis C-methylase UbiE